MGRAINADHGEENHRDVQDRADRQPGIGSDRFGRPDLVGDG